jgi:hypothetical protein
MNENINAIERNRFFENKFLKNFKLNIQEFLIRMEIHNFTINHYFKNRLRIRTSEKKEIINEKIYKPEIFLRFFYVLMPTFYLQSNLFLFIVYRKDFSLTKYFMIFLFNIVTLNLFCLYVEKKLFLQYISKPNPYSKFMREE